MSDPTGSSAPVLWLTGKPNAGKTTLALLLKDHLTAQGLRVEVLDGNELRQWLSSDLGFSPEDRAKHVMRVARLAEMLSNHGVWCLVAVIAPYRELRAEVRAMIGEGYREIYLECDAAALARRDQKGLYEKAHQGAIQNFTGISAPYEEPLCPDCQLNTEVEPPATSIEKLLAWLGQGRLLG